MRQKTINLFFCLTILFLLLQPFVQTFAPPVDDEEGLAHFPSSDSINPMKSVGSGASEEENIDSFDVSPNSGRWNVTSDNNTDDLVTDSILRMTTVNNMTADDITSGIGFEMDRGTSKTDGKVEYRMAASGGGNQTEYSRDQIGDKWDFEEGDIENFAAFSGSNSVTAANGILTITRTAVDATWGIRLTNLLISPIVYNSVRIRAKGSGADQTNLRFEWLSGTSGPFTIILQASDISSDWTDYTLDLSAQSSWTSRPNVTTIDILAATASTGILEIEFIEIVGNLDYATHIENEIEDTWDYEEGDQDGWNDNNGDNSESVVDGHYRIDYNGTSSDLRTANTFKIDSNLFTTLEIKLISNTSSPTIRIFRLNDFAEIGSSTAFASETNTTIILDLSADTTDWDGTITGLRMFFSGVNGTRLQIDYVLLLGHWADSDSVIGLWNQDDLVPLLNVSCHFTSDNSHSTTSEKAYFTVELLDMDGDVAYLAQSDNYTDISDLWIQGKITYDVLRSKLTVTINADNLTRIDKWTFPADFTEVSGRIPALFSHEKPPNVFTSTFCVATSWQEMRLGFIKAPFKEKSWREITAPTDSNWLDHSWQFARIQNDTALNQNSQWFLTIPSLDSVSGTISAYLVDPSAINNGGGFVFYFRLYGVDSDDGDLHEIVEIAILLGTAGGPGLPLIRIANGSNDVLFSKDSGAANHFEYVPKVSFSMSLSEERSIVNLKARAWSDSSNDNTTFSHMVSTLDVSDFVTVPSDEFVLETSYEVIFHWAIESETIFLLEDFGFVERDIFDDIVNAVVEPIGNFLSELFKGFFRFIAGIFKAVGDLIIGSIQLMQTALTAAINQIQGWLVTLGATITAAINQIQGWLTTLGTTITGAINNIQGWLTTLGTTITGAINNIEGWLNSIASTISSAIGDIAADIWTAFGTVASSIMSDIVDALTALASDVAAFLDAMIVFLIPLLAALAEDFAGLIEDVIAFLLPLLGALAEAIITFIADLVFWIWDALGLPDVLAILDVFLVGLVQFITGLPQLITDWIDFLTAISFLFVVLGFIWIFILPIAIAPTAGGCLEKIIEHAMTSIIADWKIFGIGGRIPMFIPWGILVIWTMLNDTVFFGFF